MTVPHVTIHYRRLPDRVQVFEQIVLEKNSDHVVTFLERASIRAPVTASERVILEPGAPVVWFTYPGLWHDIGRFHLADGTFTGIYANILTPVRMQSDQWETTDLCLDVWLGTDGMIEILDEQELAQAVDEGWLETELAMRAQEEAASLAAAASRGEWPPPHVYYWTLERARARLAKLTSTDA